MTPGILTLALACTLLSCGEDATSAPPTTPCEDTDRCDQALLASDLVCQTSPAGAACGERGGACLAERCMGDQVLVAGGPLWMGSPDGEGDLHEHPLHVRTIGSFYMDRYEVTNAQYSEFLQAAGGECPDAMTSACMFNFAQSALSDAPGYPVGADCTAGDGAAESCAAHPVVGVNWFGADAYCKWAGKRLPTDAEWSMAANGPSGADGSIWRRFPWSAGCSLGPTTGPAAPDPGCTSDALCPQGFNTTNAGSLDDAALTACAAAADFAPPANCRDVDCADGFARTAPIGRFGAGASADGVLDLAGNVREWVADCWHDTDQTDLMPFSSAPTDGSSWFDGCAYPDPEGGHQRAVRGGGWDTLGRMIRGRSREIGKNGGNDIGFRCVSDS